MIPAVLERCAGIDAGKKLVVACLMVRASDQKSTVETRQFGTTVAELEQLHDWPTCCGTA